MQKLEQYQFQGIRTDLGDKIVDKKYFYDLLNFNQDDIIGANKILAPSAINNVEFSKSNPIDGIFGFQYLDENNKLQKEEIIVSGGYIFKNFTSPQTLYSELSQGLCTFTIHQDKVYIANGQDYIKVYNGKAIYDEGAAYAEVLTTNGGLEGDYYYEVTFVTPGGEERRGSRSNTISSSGYAVKLTLPTGYDGTTERKIYRTDGALQNPKLIATISDNETLTYTDTHADDPVWSSELLTSTGWSYTSGNWTGDFASGFTHVTSYTTTLTNTIAAIVDKVYKITYTVTGRTAGSFSIAFGGSTSSGLTASGIFGPTASTTGSLVVTPTSDFNGTIVFSMISLEDTGRTTTIIDINNEAPKPYFVETSNYRLVACVSDKYPTQCWVSEANADVIDTANYLDISNQSRDNSSLIGMQRDYDKVIVASKKQVYILDCNSDTPTVTETRANVGCLNGYSMARIPSEDDNFTGGIMFIASDKTIRIFNGNFAQPVATSLDNLNTDNYGQPIKRILERLVSGYSNMHAEYYNFKYHLIIDNIILVFDIRTQAWFKYYFGNNTLLNGFFDEKYFNSDYFVTSVETRATFSYLSVIDNNFYIGRKDASLVEAMYSDWQYRGTNINSYIEFPYWGSDSELKYIKEIIIFYQKNADTKFDITVNLDDKTIAENVETEDKSGGFFDEKYFNSNFFVTGAVTEDYRVFYVNKYANWVKVVINSDNLPLIFRGMQIKYDVISNKEVV